MEKKLLKKVEESFLVREIKGTKPITAGNINSTYQVEAEIEKYILQKINKKVFTRPDEVMQNIRRVNRYLEKKVLQEGGNPDREVLHPIDTLDGTRFLIDENGDYWRMYNWIEDAKTYDNIDSPDIFYEVGAAFGEFHNRLADFPAKNLHEAIPDFHNTPKRFKDFELAVLADKSGRLQAIAGEPNHPLKKSIDYILACEDELNTLELGKKTGELPLRVTHNDTKINNVMIDDKTGKAICVIDLDTVGPDTVEVDFGDAIRSGGNPAGEEPENIKDAVLDLELFKAFTKGYLDKTLVITEDGKINQDPEAGLTENEIDLLYKAPRILALELGMRFIGDYLNGDEYFKRKEGQREDINLHRGLVQLHLAEDMKQKEEEMKEFIESYVQEKINEKMNKNKRNDQGEER